MAVDLLTHVHSLHERLDETLTADRNNEETLKLLVHKSLFNVFFLISIFFLPNYNRSLLIFSHLNFFFTL
jgi:hypothetical protein